MDPTHSHGPSRIDYTETGDVTEAHAALRREHPEPTATSTPVPLWLTLVCGLAICWAGAYLGMFHGGFRGDIFNDRFSSPDLLFPQTSTTAGGPAVAQEETPFEQGKAVFGSICASCHQPSGLGLPNQFPPLAGSEFALGSEKRMAAIVLKGLQGPVTVKGANFNSAMQAWEGTLSDKKIAAVMTYVRSSWGNHASAVTPAQIAAARKEYADHKASMTAPEVLQIPADATLPGGEAPGAAPEPGAAAPAPGAAPAGSAPAAAAPAPADAAAEIAAGKTVYMAICIACHQPTGMGLPMVFPPLTKSPYVNGPPDRFVAMILKGNMGPMTIGGKPVNNIMTPQEAVLTDEKIAAVASFVRSTFENSAPPISPDLVKEVRAKFADRKTGWTQPELDAWKSDVPAK